MRAIIYILLFAGFLGAPTLRATPVISEFMAMLISPIKKYNPKLSRFAVTYISTDFIFSAKKARKDFGYKPKYSQEDATNGTIAFYRKANPKNNT